MFFDSFNALSLKIYLLEFRILHAANEIANGAQKTGKQRSYVEACSEINRKGQYGISL